MIRASALYISLIVSILVALICGSILLIAYMYKMHDNKVRRHEKLVRNVESASLLVMQNSLVYDSVQHISLFENKEEPTDSVVLEKRHWGIYELGLVASFINRDSVKKAFLIGFPSLDTTTALYITDEDRPISISGKSGIKGTAYLPKSGIKAAYVDASYYNGEKLIYGSVLESARELPSPNTTLIKNLNVLLSDSQSQDEQVLPDSESYSFFKDVKRVKLPKEHLLISNSKIKGNIIISSDSLILVDASSNLDQVILVAPYVKILSGFKGRLQVIASDSIHVEESVKLGYPSALVLIKSDTAGFQPRMNIGRGSVIKGQLFAWEKQRSQMMPVIKIGTGTTIKGEIWSKGYVDLGRSSKVNGTVSAIRLMANISSVLYENYLIDVIINRKSLSKYYRGSKMFNSSDKPGSILCYLQ